jgi:hypothetical protein
MQKNIVRENSNPWQHSTVVQDILSGDSIHTYDINIQTVVVDKSQTVHNKHKRSPETLDVVVTR